MRVDCLDMQGALVRIESFVEAGGHHLVATVNPEFVMRARKDPEFARILDSASLCLPDGSGVVWAARRQGCDMSGPVTGVDLIPPLARLCAERGWRMYLLGAADGVAADLAARLREDNPKLSVEASAAAGAEQIADYGPQVLLVAFGAPKQEKWIDTDGRSSRAPVQIGVGGSFDYLTGRVRRAPEWMRKAGLEWLFRLAVQPWRLRRMLVLPVFAFNVLKES